MDKGKATLKEVIVALTGPDKRERYEAARLFPAIASSPVADVLWGAFGDRKAIGVELAMRDWIEDPKKELAPEPQPSQEAPHEVADAEPARLQPGSAPASGSDTPTPPDGEDEEGSFEPQGKLGQTVRALSRGRKKPAPAPEVEEPKPVSTGDPDLDELMREIDAEPEPVAQAEEEE